MTTYIDIVNECATKLGIDLAKEVAPAYRVRNRITMYDLLLALVSTTATEDAAIILNSSKTYVLKYCKESLKPYFHGKLPNTQWYTTIFSSTDYRYCFKCSTIKLKNNFSIGASKCKECVVLTSLAHRAANIDKYKEHDKQYYLDNKDSIQEKAKKYHEEHRDYYIEASKAHYHNNKEMYLAYNAKRRADKLKATPSWANLEIIKSIYKNAEGMHVDHIIPLQGKLVCGLHVENNLQYLTPEENIAKGNKFDIDTQI
jgi:hypothetical protein